MAEESAGEKTEDASPKKRKESRDKGNVAKSTEVNSVLVLLMGIIMLRITAPSMFNTLAGDLRKTFSMISDPTLDAPSLIKLFTDSIAVFFVVTLPICLGIMVIGIVANVMQVGFLFTLKPITPKLEKINPISGFQRMFSMRSVVEAVKSILKLIAIGVVAYIAIEEEFDTMMTLSSASVGGFWYYLLMLSYKIVMRIAMVLIIIAILDYSFQRFEHEKKLRMSIQEVKEERKQMEGDPMVKARIRSLQREMARRRMMDEVPKATVVVTNPTHLAIAIRYEPAEMATPVVVAKGKMVLAERIKEIAKEHAIPIVEDKPLARAMFDLVEPGDQIPVDFFNAVAEILAYVYKLKKGERGS